MRRKSLETFGETMKQKSIEKLCFVCQEKRKSDNFPLNQGGLGRCTEERAGNRIKERASIFLKDEDSRFHNAAIKLNILLAGSKDICAADVYYHQSCYLKYAVNKIEGNAESNENEKHYLQIFWTIFYPELNDVSFFKSQLFY